MSLKGKLRVTKTVRCGVLPQAMGACMLGSMARRGNCISLMDIDDQAG
jgi:hypothetical protein